MYSFSEDIETYKIFCELCFPDFTIKVNNETIKCHRDILIKSKKLKELIENGWYDFEENLLELNDDYELIFKMIKYMYDKKICFDNVDQLIKCLNLNEIYDIDGLKNTLHKILKKYSFSEKNYKLIEKSIKNKDYLKDINLNTVQYTTAQYYSLNNLLSLEVVEMEIKIVDITTNKTSKIENLNINKDNHYVMIPISGDDERSIFAIVQEKIFFDVFKWTYKKYFKSMCNIQQGIIVPRDVNSFNMLLTEYRDKEDLFVMVNCKY